MYYFSAIALIMSISFIAGCSPIPDLPGPLGIPGL